MLEVVFLLSKFLLSVEETSVFRSSPGNLKQLGSFSDPNKTWSYLVWRLPARLMNDSFPNHSSGRWLIIIKPTRAVQCSSDRVLVMGKLRQSMRTALATDWAWALHFIPCKFNLKLGCLPNPVQCKSSGPDKWGVSNPGGECADVLLSDSCLRELN